MRFAFYGALMLKRIKPLTKRELVEARVVINSNKYLATYNKKNSEYEYIITRIRKSKDVP